MQALSAVVLLLAVAPVVALALKKLKLSGWSIIGGILAGVLLGPTIFGRVMPVSYESVFVGGAIEREQLRALHGRQGADRIAAEAARFDQQQLQELLARHQSELSQAEAALADARWQHQSLLRITAIVLVVLTLLGSSLAVETIPGHRASLIAPMTIGLWSAFVPGALAIMAGHLWWREPWPDVLLVAAAIMIGPWALTAVDRRAANSTEHGGAHLIQSAGRVASLCAIITCAWAAWLLRGGEGLLHVAPLLALVLAWISPLSHLPGSAARATHHCVMLVILPALAASVAIKIDLISHFTFWPILVLALISGDGRWLGAVAGVVSLGGRSATSSMRMTMGSMACGPTQLALLALAAHAWMIGGKLALALLAGIVYVEASVRLRRIFAAMTPPHSA